MMRLLQLLAIVSLVAPSFTDAVGIRRPSSPTVDLGYAIYQGVHEAPPKLNVWKGLRYAAPPTGPQRWKAPLPPTVNRKNPTPAAEPGPQCPQTFPGALPYPFTPGDEDCLFLDVTAPDTIPRGGLPVLVWIHGGGYGYGNGTRDFSTLMGANGNNFIGVSIQHRLGAFGFLSSEEVKEDGVLNAGLLDQAFALEWVHKHIGQFGGDPARVTVSGQSSGGGSVVLLATAMGGEPEKALFRNGIAASPYMPTQWDYNDHVPTNLFYRFSQEVGCPGSGPALDCLRSKDSLVLQKASNKISQQSNYGEWAFLPVVDGSLIRELTSAQLGRKAVSGGRVLVGSNANEGGVFIHDPVAPLISDDQLRRWLAQYLPNLLEEDIDHILARYPAASSMWSKQETDGIHAPFATHVSQDALGFQQRANNIYAEATIVCPSYWLASAYDSPGNKAFHFQYSVPFAAHDADLSAYFGPATPNQGDEFVLALRRAWGQFIQHGDPSIPDGLANGGRNTTSHNPASSWPTWCDDKPRSINLNETGGVPYDTVTAWGTPVVQYRGPGLSNDITEFDARAWEAGRGDRCEFWRSLGPKIRK